MNKNGVLANFACVMLAIATLAAQPAERDSRKDTERKSESARDRESYRERYLSVDRLPVEFQKSSLFQYEGRDPRTGEERGETLRKHVAERATVEGIREQMMVQEHAEVLSTTAGGKTEGAARREGRSGLDGSRRERRDIGENGSDGNDKRSYRSMYVDLQTAERVIWRTVKENQAIVDAWTRKDSRENLLIRHEHENNIGVVMLIDSEGRAGRDARLLPSQTSVVEFAKDREGRPFIAKSFPAIDGSTIEALRRTSPVEATYAEGIIAQERQVILREKLGQAPARQEALPTNLAEVWNRPPTARGNAIESYLARTEYKDWFNVGQLKNGKFRLVDFQRGDRLVSLKSVDTTRETWLTRMQDHIHDLGSIPASVNDRSAKMILDIRVQPGGIASAKSLIEYGKKYNVEVKVEEFK